MKKEILENAFRKYVGTAPGGHSSLEIKAIDYLIVLVNDNDIEQCQQTIATIVNIANGEANIESFGGTVLRILIGAPLPNPNASQLRIRLTNEIIQNVGSVVSIIHGKASCYVGEVGTDKRRNYTAVIQGYRGILSELVALPWGMQKEHKAT